MIAADSHARPMDLPPGMADQLHCARLPYRRGMTDEELANLRVALTRGLGIKISRELVASVADYCCHVERRIDGRAAGNVEDLVLRFMIRLVTSLAAPAGTTDACHLEIGALFGAATVYSCQGTRIAGRDHRTVVIDPFSGYYGQALDPVSGVAVSEQVFRSNLAKFGFDDGRVQILRGLSTDPEIVRKTRGLRLLSLFIDGDHSYDGIKQDWINYAGLVEPGGLVLIDDYNGRNWPDVTDFVNREVLAYLAGEWEPRLVFGSSIVFQRSRPAGAEAVPARLVHELADANRVIAGQSERIAGQSERIAGLERRLAGMQNSGSWKMTAPLRWLRRKFLQRFQ